MWFYIHIGQIVESDMVLTRLEGDFWVVLGSEKVDFIALIVC
jgi:hypothetical protein